MEITVKALRQNQNQCDLSVVNSERSADGRCSSKVGRVSLYSFVLYSSAWMPTEHLRQHSVVCAVSLIPLWMF